ncbi:hypothetical protein [Kineosporia sp. A_224]|uniref:DUF7662 domain-containing protein n=1 Tax=Kineosporia sp. A_224 TaxID=1962180 RepID=UPI00117AFE05|nr:hypothetical protein [Kineosporia sp. A_224]
MFGRQTVREHVTGWVDRAIDVQDGALRAYVAQVRSATAQDGAPDADAQLLAALESHYLATTSGAGAVVGGAASVPGVGTGVAVGLSVAETVAFLDGTALFTLAAAQVAGAQVSDLPRRRALLLLALLGDEAVRLVPAGADGGTDGWGHRLAALPDAAVEDVNRTAETWLLTRFGARQGLFVLGRLAPFGIGAAVGAAGNALTAKGVIARTRAAYAAPGEPAAVVRLVGPAADEGDAPDGPAPDVTTGLPAGGPPPLVGPPTGKYAPLYTLLAARRGGTVRLRLADVDAAVTGGLPAVARRSPDWWTGDRTAQSKAWHAAGLHVTDVDLDAGTVRLRRGEPALR